jgi:hypothetical protein
MKITSTVTTPAPANAWRRFGRWTRMDEDSRTTASGFLRRHARRVGLLDLADDVRHGFLNLLHGAALAGPAKVRDSVADVQAVPRQLVRERQHLASERPAYPAQDREREEGSDEDRRHPTQPSPVKGAHDGTQEEREQDGQRQGDQHGLQPIQARNDQRDDPPRLHVRSSTDAR